jgi:hypothetical protein
VLTLLTVYLAKGQPQGVAPTFFHKTSFSLRPLRETFFSRKARQERKEIRTQRINLFYLTFFLCGLCAFARNFLFPKAQFRI